MTLHRLPMLLPVCLLLTGCEQEMARQPRYDPLEKSDFFADGRSARPLEPDTVARGQLRADREFYTGRHGSKAERELISALVDAALAGDLSAVLAGVGTYSVYVDEFPIPITRPVLERGRERFGIFCAVCHGSLGDGKGKVVERGYVKPPSYHIDRLRKAPVGYYFEVITNGYGAMPDHASQVPPRDRWAIIAYIRALQFSQHVPVNELTAEERSLLPKP